MTWYDKLFIVSMTCWVFSTAGVITAFAGLLFSNRP